MKALVFAAALVVSTVASASTLHVSPNIFLASGPATANYFVNLTKIGTEVKKVTQAEMGRLTFDGATVNAAAGTIDYTFHRYEGDDGKQTCWSYVKFTTTKETAVGQGPTVSNVKAELSCSLNQD